ncbi:MAG: folate family ECF transporter S component [Oscillospiraceae bacterium]|jgi:ECF transporter S component (folate family)|nr:folate family ECF transporter S component [Oscillospiraceae bacterium]
METGNDTAIVGSAGAAVKARRRVWSVKSVVSMGLLCSLSVVLGTALSFNMIPFGGTYTFKIAINLLPVHLSALCFGPLGGFVVGVIADFLKWAIAPVGFYHPGIGIDMGLSGAIVAVTLALIQRRRARLAHEPDAEVLGSVTLLNILPGVAVSQIICSMMLNSYWIASMQHVSVWVTLPPRVVNAAVMIPVYALLLRACARYAKRFGLA